MLARTIHHDFVRFREIGSRIVRIVSFARHDRFFFSINITFFASNDFLLARNFPLRWMVLSTLGDPLIAR